MHVCIRARYNVLPKALLSGCLPEDIDFCLIACFHESIVDNDKWLRRDVVGEWGKRGTRHFAIS